MVKHCCSFGKNVTDSKSDENQLPTATTNTAVCSRYGKAMRHVTHSLPAGNSTSCRNTTRGTRMNTESQAPKEI